MFYLYKLLQTFSSLDSLVKKDIITSAETWVLSKGLFGKQKPQP